MTMRATLRLLTLSLGCVSLTTTAVAPAFAAPPDSHHGGRQPHAASGNRPDGGRAPEGRHDGGGPDRGRQERRPADGGHPDYRPIYRGPAYTVPAGRVRHYHNVTIIRPHGHWYYGYGRYYSDDSALAWLAFTAITLVLLDQLNEDQQRAHEDAQIRATTAPVKETITWADGDASGSVTTTREGRSSTGRYCREFRQTITIAGKQEQAYGTACQQPDGTWEIVSTEN